VSPTLEEWPKSGGAKKETGPLGKV
jgi:hypothetical protein